MSRKCNSVIISFYAASGVYINFKFSFMIQLFQESENISLKINVLSTQMANIENRSINKNNKNSKSANTEEEGRGEGRRAREKERDFKHPVSILDHL